MNEDPIVWSSCGAPHLRWILGLGRCDGVWSSERFHVVKFEIRLPFGFGPNCRKDFRLVKIDVALRTIIFVRCYARLVLFLTTNVTFVLWHSGSGFPGCFADVGVVFFSFAVAIQIVDELARRKLSFIFRAYYVLKAETGSWLQHTVKHMQNLFNNLFRIYFLKDHPISFNDWVQNYGQKSTTIKQQNLLYPWGYV